VLLQALGEQRLTRSKKALDQLSKIISMSDPQIEVSKPMPQLVPQISHHNK